MRGRLVREKWDETIFGHSVSVMFCVVVAVVVAVVVDMNGGSVAEDVGGGGGFGVGTGIGGGSIGAEAGAGAGNGIGTGSGMTGSRDKICVRVCIIPGTGFGQVLLWMSTVVVIVGVIVQTRFEGKTV